MILGQLPCLLATIATIDIVRIRLPYFSRTYYAHEKLGRLIVGMAKLAIVAKSLVKNVFSGNSNFVDCTDRCVVLGGNPSQQSLSGHFRWTPFMSFLTRLGGLKEK